MSKEKLIHGKTLKYWRVNAEEDYMKTPISVLKYITCFEELERLKKVNGEFTKIGLIAWVFKSK